MKMNQSTTRLTIIKLFQTQIIKKFTVVCLLLIILHTVSPLLQGIQYYVAIQRLLLGDQYKIIDAIELIDIDHDGKFEVIAGNVFAMIPTQTVYKLKGIELYEVLAVNPGRISAYKNSLYEEVVMNYSVCPQPGAIDNDQLIVVQIIHPDFTIEEKVNGLFSEDESSEVLSGYSDYELIRNACITSDKFKFLNWMATYLDQ